MFVIIRLVMAFFKNMVFLRQINKSYNGSCSHFRSNCPSVQCDLKIYIYSPQTLNPLSAHLKSRDQKLHNLQSVSSIVWNRSISDRSRIGYHP